MDSAELRAVQQPLKDAYRQSPGKAVVTLRAAGQLDEQAISCSVDVYKRQGGSSGVKISEVTSGTVPPPTPPR